MSAANNTDGRLSRRQGVVVDMDVLEALLGTFVQSEAGCRFYLESRQKNPEHPASFLLHAFSITANVTSVPLCSLGMGFSTNLIVGNTTRPTSRSFPIMFFLSFTRGDLYISDTQVGSMSGPRSSQQLYNVTDSLLWCLAFFRTSLGEAPGRETVLVIAPFFLCCNLR